MEAWVGEAHGDLSGGEEDLQSGGRWEVGERGYRSVRLRGSAFGWVTTEMHSRIPTNEKHAYHAR